MSEQTVSGAVEQTGGMVALIDRQTVEFGKVLPARLGPERFARWALTVYRNGIGNPDQRQREAWQRVVSTEHGRLSVIGALMNCATLGLEPGREYHLVPFGDLVQGITDYKGEIRLITNARRCSVIARLVRKGDSFYMRAANAAPMHEPPDTEDSESWFDDSRPVIGGYAYADYGNDEISLVIRMSEDMFLKHRAKARTTNVWDEWPEDMRLKTLVHGLRKWVPWSAEWVA